MSETNTNPSASVQHQQMDERILSLMLGSKRYLEFADPGDEVFQNENHGLWNSTRLNKLAQDMAEQNLTYKAELVGLDEQMIAFIEDKVQIDERHLLAMPEQRRAAPILIVTLDDEAPHLLIDGHHRVMRKWRDGGREIWAYIIPPEFTSLPQYHMPRAEVDEELKLVANRMLYTDYSKIEERIFNWIFEKKDPHTMRAMELYGVGEHEVSKRMRAYAKQANFVFLYSNRGVARLTGRRVDVDAELANWSKMVHTLPKEKL